MIPLIVNIKCRMLCFWSKLVSSEKLSSKIYNLTYNLHKNGTNGNFILFTLSFVIKFSMDFSESSKVWFHTKFLFENRIKDVELLQKISIFIKCISGLFQ
jgi:hypothetical protein